LAVATIHTEDEVFTEFKKIYKKQPANWKGYYAENWQ
jgi:hypothetical protein